MKRTESTGSLTGLANTLPSIHYRPCGQEDMDKASSNPESSREVWQHILPSGSLNNRRSSLVTSPIDFARNAKDLGRDGKEFEEIIYLGNEDDALCARAVAKLTIAEGNTHAEKSDGNKQRLVYATKCLPSYTQSKFPTTDRNYPSQWKCPTSFPERTRKDKPLLALNAKSDTRSSLLTAGSKGARQGTEVGRKKSELPKLAQISEVLCGGGASGVRYGRPDIHLKRRARTTQIEEYLRRIERQYNIVEDKAKKVSDWLQSLEN